MEGILRAYNRTLESVQLSGPTLFAPIIQQACAIAASSSVSQAVQKYFVLLIITDGEGALQYASDATYA